MKKPAVLILVVLQTTERIFIGNLNLIHQDINKLDTISLPHLH